MRYFGRGQWRSLSFSLKRALLLFIVIVGSYFLVSNLLMVATTGSNSRVFKKLLRSSSDRYGSGAAVNWTGKNVKRNEFVAAYGGISLDHANESDAFLIVEESAIEAARNAQNAKIAEQLSSKNETTEHRSPNSSLVIGGNLNSDNVKSGRVKSGKLGGLMKEKGKERTEGRDNNDRSNRRLCSEKPEHLTGHMKQAVLLIPTLKMAEVVKSHPGLGPGGSWSPPDCRARHKVAIILPFRDRQSHLNRLLDYMIPMLQRQQLDFRFIVTEQYGHDLFNKGRIMNAAFEVAESMGVDCVLFHDVDMFPQDDRNIYGCSQQPKHLGAFVNSLGYELWYDYIVGGVLVIRCDHFRQVNGYSNMYWAWGGEDDDMGKRILANNFKIERPNKEYSRYTMLKHIKRTRTAPSLIYKLLASAGDRWKTDGLSNHQWRIIKLTKTALYYHLFVDVGRPPEEWKKA